MLEARQVSKSYPGVRALADVSLAVAPGECVALIGENGAGKSTLIRSLSGIENPDSGQVATSGPIAVIFQELTAIPDLDVASNIYLGHEPKRGPIIDQAKLHADAAAVLARIGSSIAPTTMMRDLSVASQQMVEIAKAIARQAKFVIMDEPTSSLSAGETDALLSLVQELKASGVGVLYVSHRLGEIMRIADRVVALRDGKNAGELTAAEMTIETMVQMMVGRELAAYEPKAHSPGATRLQVTGLRTKANPEREITFCVAAGEVVCLAGLVGAGRTEVVEALAGVQKPRGGSVQVDGREVPLNNVRAAIGAGICLVPEDRRQSGLLTELSVLENFALPNRHAARLDTQREQELATSLVEKMSVKTSTTSTAVRTLSGGNQQKIVIGKWLPHQPKVLILDEPTRGIDVGSKAEIYDLIQNLVEQGMACLVVSSDMEEVLRLGDRILVMSEGRLSGELSRTEATEEAIMALAAPV
ncbi:MAG: sugar ABC transporter ATP-binding protein [Chthonomonas sp.]|nr:sugar ABC transporter ATP-binding protein [Chthonomonas sp.]